MRKKTNKFKVGDRIIGNSKASTMYGITKKGWKGTVVDIDGDWMEAQPSGNWVGPTGNYNLNPKYFDLLKPKKILKKMSKPKDRMFTNSQKIRLRLKVYFDKNNTGYSDFEEFYTDFTDSMLDNLEFIVKSFKF